MCPERWHFARIVACWNRPQHGAMGNGSSQSARKWVNTPLTPSPGKRSVAAPAASCVHPITKINLAREDPHPRPQRVALFRWQNLLYLTGQGRRRLRGESELKDISVGADRPISVLGSEVIGIFGNHGLNYALRQLFRSYIACTGSTAIGRFRRRRRSVFGIGTVTASPPKALRAMLVLTDAGENLRATRFMTRADTIRYRAASYFGHETRTRLPELARSVSDLLD